METSLDWHWDGRDGPTILKLSWLYYQAALIACHPFVSGVAPSDMAQNREGIQPQHA